MNHKVGDTVRIRSREWIDAQEKNVYRNITSGSNSRHLTDRMFVYAGKLAKIVLKNEKEGYYRLDIDGGTWYWEDWMFDPAYKADGPLAPEDAIRAMLDGETLYDSERNGYFWFNTGAFKKVYDGGAELLGEFRIPNLYRRVPKRKRDMTREEVRAWAKSPESYGWMVRINLGQWDFPSGYNYDSEISRYERAKINATLSGVDESTIQGFEVEE
jgi:hypothetical protein